MTDNESNLKTNEWADNYKVDDDLMNIVKSELSKAKDDYTYIPSSQLLNNAIEDFLSNDHERSWIQTAVDNDAALAVLGDDGIPKTGENKHFIPKENIEEQINTYQGLHAIALHRVAHQLYTEGHDKNNDEASRSDLLAKARLLSQGARRLTAGIEIHPGAQIGKNFFIDHGTGTVIGEKANIGDDEMLYHTVTLGAYSPKVVDSDGRRHPNVHGDNVMIGNGAQLLGPVHVDSNTKIGSGAKVYGRVEIDKNVKIAPDVKIYGGIKENDKTLHIGDNAMIVSDVAIDSDVKEGQKIIGAMPMIPGIDNNNLPAGTLIAAEKGYKKPQRPEPIIRTDDTFIEKLKNILLISNKSDIAK